jgi:cation:H+ antiporter
MTTTLIQFSLSALAVIFAGIFLTRSADAISKKTKMGKLLAGSILLAGATSLPELMVDISAVRKDMPLLLISCTIVRIKCLHGREQNTLYRLL